MAIKNPIFAACVFMFALGGSAQAADVQSPWLLRAGVGDVQFGDKLTFSLGGQPVPNAASHFHQTYTPVVEIGYFFDQDFAAVATIGYPPAITVSGGGSLAPYGKLASTTLGPSAFTLQYQPVHDGVVRPYVGAGLAYMVIFSTRPQLVQKPTLSDAVSPALELGSEFALSDNYNLFAEAKRAFLQSDATGTVTGYPATGKASIGPWVFVLGASLRL